ncbi:MAG: hypothetical protein CMO04_16300 [Thalassospira sp.]|nr:hypothetical protein [Thalassospira sp.]
MTCPLQIPDHETIKIGGTYTLNRDVALNEETLLFSKGEMVTIEGRRCEIAGRFIIARYMRLAGRVKRIGEAYVHAHDFVEGAVS